LLFLSFICVEVSIGDVAGGWSLWGLAILFLLMAFANFKCTSTGSCRGFDFYFFNFYLNECLRWEKFPYLDIQNLGFSCGVSWNTPISLFFRFMVTNFDEMAELISRNTLIKSEIRQSFVDYVNARKQQSIIYRILLPKTIEIIIFLYMMREIVEIIRGIIKNYIQ
jgi:hypothetical protein